MVKSLTIRDLQTIALARARFLAQAIAMTPIMRHGKEAIQQALVGLEDDLRNRPQHEMDYFTLLLLNTAYQNSDGYPTFFWDSFDPHLTIELDRVSSHLENEHNKMLDKALELAQPPKHTN